MCMHSATHIHKTIAVHLPNDLLPPAWSRRPATASLQGTGALTLPSLLPPLVLVVWIAASPTCSGLVTTTPLHYLGITSSLFSSRTTTLPAGCRPLPGCPPQPVKDTPTSSHGTETHHNGTKITLYLLQSCSQTSMHLTRLLYHFQCIMCVILVICVGSSTGLRLTLVHCGWLKLCSLTLPRIAYSFIMELRI